MSESNVEDDYSTEEDEIVPTHTQGEMAHIGIIPITMERSSAPTNDRLDIIDDKVRDNFLTRTCTILLYMCMILYNSW